MNNHQARILRRRSPPRIITLEGGLGGNHPLKIRQTIPNITHSTDKKPSLIPKLQEIVQIGQIEKSQNNSSDLTTVSDYPNQVNLPRVSVSRRPTSTLKILEEKKPEPVHTPQNKVKMPQFGSGYQNRIERNSRSKAMMNEGAVVESGTRQVWALPQSYRPEVHSHQPCLVVSGNQGLRISFHRDAGSILQDLEIPPSEEETEIGLPEGTRMFTIQGMGGGELIDSEIEPSAGSISEMYPNGALSCIGFQRLSTVHQIGYFRYLSRGMFIQAQESPSRKIMENISLFSAGEVLSKIDNIRIYSSSKIRTFVVIVRTLENCQPKVKLAMEGVEHGDEPSVIERSDGYAYVWSVEAEDEFLGPAIIDIETDETTDVNSVLAFRAGSEQVLGVLRASMWTKLVPNSTLSPDGISTVCWSHDADEKIDKVDSIVPKNWKLSQSKISSVERRPVPKPQPQPVSKPTDSPRAIRTDLPEIEATPAQSNQKYTFDLSQFAADEDEDDTMTFKLTSGPNWLTLSPDGILTGIPSNQNEGRNEVIVRVSDGEGLSSDAMIIIEVEVKSLNRAPYWKPNITKKTNTGDGSTDKIKRNISSDKKANPKQRRRR
ncbi:MAG: hypothetical protein CL988_01185 [Euryarchaeota archaeon]|nr:hypothetical protein [Euryarchaeota archaeon]